MMIRRSHLAVLVMLVLIAAAVSVATWHGSGGDARKDVDQGEGGTRLQKASSVLHRTPVMPLNDTAAIRAALREAVARSGRLSPAKAAAVTDEVIDFLASRFADGADATTSTAWRESTGYQRRTLDELRSTWFVDAAYEAYFGRRPPPELTWDAYYDAMVSGQNEFAGGRTVPRGIGTAPESVRVALKRLTRADPRWPALDGPIGDALDHGGPIHISTSWWAPPVSMRELLVSHGAALGVSIGFVMEFADGTRRPFGVSLFEDPRSGAWYVEAVFHGHLDSGDREGVRWEY